MSEALVLFLTLNSVLNETWERVCSDGTKPSTDQEQPKSNTKSEALNLEAAAGRCVLGVCSVCSCSRACARALGVL